MSSEQKIRQPIVTVVGHVDHGKTSLLDSLRKTCVTDEEAGGITQKISFTLYPAEQVKQACPLIEKSGIKLNIPGFLLIDTPGHAAFTNLRKRGGSLADLAVLVIDINEGIKPQTAEVIQILKHNKTPFLIALNKIDRINGWRKQSEELMKNIESQSLNARQDFDEKLFTLQGALHSHGFETDLYYNITDFTKKVALVPCSAKTLEGIQELIMMLCGMSQKYLADKLKLNEDPKGIILEVKKDKSQSYAESILYDGELSKSDEIAISNLDGEIIITKIRVLEEIQPLCAKFSPTDKVTASTGLRIQFIDKSEILPGMPFMIYKNNKKEIEQIFKKELSENISSFLSKQGVIAKADSLGSLEALLVLLKQSNIQVVKAKIGNINKTDIISAKANLELSEIDSVVVGFNVSIDDDAQELLKSEKKIKVMTDDVIYKLIENLEKWRGEKNADIERKRLMELSTICKVSILHKYVFRNSNPAIFGVRVEAGKLKSGTQLIDKTDDKVARIKHIEEDKKSFEEVGEGKEVAISLPGINFDRRLAEVDVLYSDISSSQFKKFKQNKDLLTQNEIKTLQEIAEIKRKANVNWGM
ncbi:translation initiation factor IF-2 [Candidatus Pacearchaeota archaeon CG10_big_fil_rev_8_21_14_0_10_32_14]|nr:MAG: translation initiation factor IF-2 [Candidatus Pacearchaeota archaeon CG10_big_fil_rev_8_21_14_0_10_32_14]